MQIAIEPLQAFSARALQVCFDLSSPMPDALGKLSKISVVVVSDRRIAAVHKKFMNITGATDVLTFQHGEIVLSAETAQSNAARFHSSTEDEIRLYVIHGLLHLAGYDDQTAEEARIMETVQAEVLHAALQA